MDVYCNQNGALIHSGAVVANNMNAISKTLAILVIGINIYPCIPNTFGIIKSQGGGFGYGLLLLPILFIVHLSLISAFLTFFKKLSNEIALVVSNSVGLIVGAFYISMLIRVG